MWSDTNSIGESDSMNVQDFEATTPLLDVKDVTTTQESSAFVPEQRWLTMFPNSFEAATRSFDDYCIKIVQRYHSKGLAYFDLCITAFVAIETGIACPFILYVLGFDGLATELSYLMLLLALFSQIPKRFIWRFRPYMAKRALKIRKKETAVTSSFPSRAVTCAVVYAFVIIYAYLYKIRFQIDWWMPILLLGFTILSSFSRVNLGVHYPSDCVAGFFQGVIVCVLGTLFFHADTLGCFSCFDSKCYSTDPQTTIDGVNFFNTFPFIVLVVSLCIATIITVISVIKPIDFWQKCDRVYGMLLPGIIFQLTCLCPHTSGTSIAHPTHSVPWYGYFYAFGFVGIATLLQFKNNGKFPILVFLLSFVILYTALLVWRLWIFV